jgi:hypothetical protein
MKRTDIMSQTDAQRKLRLGRETLRELSVGDLRLIAGGLGGSGGRGQFKI